MTICNLMKNSYFIMLLLFSWLPTSLFAHHINWQIKQKTTIDMLTIQQLRGAKMLFQQKETAIFSYVPAKKKRKSNKKQENSDTAIHPRGELLKHSPIHNQRAWMYSTILPGWGQIYNQNYWKIPLFYGVFTILIGFAVYNHKEYITAKREQIAKSEEENKPIPAFSNLGNYIKAKKKDRTIFIAVAGLWYLINIFDAYVFSSLKTFDVSDDLTVIVTPTQFQDSYKYPGAGIAIKFQLK